MDAGGVLGREGIVSAGRLGMQPAGITARVAAFHPAFRFKKEGCRGSLCGFLFWKALET